MLNYLLMFLLFVTAFFLIILILIQRGKGGGLAGAFGGLGGQSAFGTKAGDLFTRITIVVAVFWILLCVASVKFLSTTQTRLKGFGSKAPVRAGETPGQSGSDKATDGTGGSEDGGGSGGERQPSGSGDHE